MENRPKMPPSERAKQFAPFAAVRGLYEAIAEKEHTKVPRRELSEDAAEELNRKLQQLRIGQLATVEYYTGSDYRQITGMVAKIDPVEGVLQIVDKKICFSALADVTQE